MSVNIIFRIAAVGILVTILVQVLKHSGRDEQAFLLYRKVRLWLLSKRKIAHIKVGRANR